MIVDFPINSHECDIAMAFQVATCLAFVEPIKKDVSFEEMMTLTMARIGETEHQSSNDIPKLHGKLCEMGFHLFQKAIERLTSDAVKFHRQYSSNIVGTLIARCTQ